MEELNDCVYSIAEVQEFPLDWNVFYEKEPNDKNVVLVTWKYSFFNRTENIYKKRSPEEVLDFLKILKGSLAKELVNITVILLLLLCPILSFNLLRCFEKL